MQASDSKYGEWESIDSGTGFGPAAIRSPSAPTPPTPQWNMQTPRTGPQTYWSPPGAMRSPGISAASASAPIPTTSGMSISSTSAPDSKSRINELAQIATLQGTPFLGPTAPRAISTGVAVPSRAAVDEKTAQPADELHTDRDPAETRVFIDQGARSEELNSGYREAARRALLTVGLQPWEEQRFTDRVKIGQGAHGTVFSAFDQYRARSSAFAGRIQTAADGIRVAEQWRLAKVQELVALSKVKNIDAVRLANAGRQEEQASALLQEAHARWRALQTVVVKRIAKVGFPMRLLLAELRALRKLASVCNEYVLCFDGGFFEDQDAYYLTTEYLADYVTLSSVLGELSLAAENMHSADPQTRASSERVLLICRNLIDGLALIHRNGVAHRDVKPDNILVQRNGSRIKYIDFGLSCTNDFCEQAYLRNGSPAYHPPELLLPNELLPNGQVAGLTLFQQSDLWALGMTLYEVVNAHARPQASTSWLQAYKLIHRLQVGQVQAKLDERSNQEWPMFARLFDYASVSDPLVYFNAQTEDTLARLSDEYNVRHSNATLLPISLSPLLQRDPRFRRLPSTAPATLASLYPTNGSLPPLVDVKSPTIAFPPVASIAWPASTAEPLLLLPKTAASPSVATPVLVSKGARPPASPDLRLKGGHENKPSHHHQHARHSHRSHKRR